MNFKMKNLLECNLREFNVNELSLNELELINGGGDGSFADRIGWTVGVLVGSTVCAAKCVATWVMQAKAGDLLK